MLHCLDFLGMAIEEDVSIDRAIITFNGHYLSNRVDRIRQSLSLFCVLTRVVPSLPIGKTGMTAAARERERKKFVDTMKTK